jgi:hypothetical protein
VLFVLLVANMHCSSARGEPSSWLQRLPAGVRAKILWSTDYETGDLRQWQRPHAKHPGSGIFNTGGQDAIARASDGVVHSGQWALETTIQNANRAANGPRAVRMMVWTDRSWDDGGDYFPDEAYYSTWMYFPHAYDPKKHPPWDPGDGGWWNVMQFKSEDASGESQPTWTLNVARTQVGELTFYLHSPVNSPSSYSPAQPSSFPAGNWVHVEVLYISAVGPAGRIAVFLNGERILAADAVVTSLGGKTGHDPHPIWGIGNYTDHIAGDPAGDGRATVYFDDAAVSLVPLAPFARKSLNAAR